MNDNNLSVSFSVPQAPADVFAAILNVRGWWSRSLEGSSAALGDEFRYRHGEIHDSHQRVVEVVPNQKVEWLVTDACLSFAANKTEWKGTHVRFEVQRIGNQTEVRLTHLGLTPACQCFDACSKGWAFYVGKSLRDLITTGVGQPD